MASSMDAPMTSSCESSVASNTARHTGLNPRVETIWRVACAQWRLLWRDRVAVLALMWCVLLTIAAAFTAWDRRHATNHEREWRQAQFDQGFDLQPDRHPHRMAHYGHFVFRPLSPLAAFDSGIDPYTGNTLFLEAHRQNTANFGDARQSSLLLRFGQLTPAFVLQFLAPLLLIFACHAVVARERESGTLRVLLAQGVGGKALAAGKLVAVVALAAVLALPAVVALAGMVVFSDASAALALLLAAGYGLWLLLWAVGIVLVSMWAARGRDALVALLAIWALGVVLLPRLSGDAIALSGAVPTRFESSIAVTREMVEVGDRLNPDDPHFNAFREQVLAEYGVDSIDALPINYIGLRRLEGERITSRLFEKYAQMIYQAQSAQSDKMDRLAWISPVIALRRLSMAMAGSDWYTQRRFLEQAEQHRENMQLMLAKLERDHIEYAPDLAQADLHLSNTHWQGLADFHYQAAGAAETLQRIWPQFGILLMWLLALSAGCVAVGKRLQRRL